MQSLRNFAGLVKLAIQSGSFSWLLWTLLGKRKLVHLSVTNVPIDVRTGSHDLYVACETLRREYREFFPQVPKLDNAFIVDAGAYIGTSAIAFARQYPDSTIVAIEPDAENFQLLVMNAANWPNIHCLQAALVPVPGAVSLFDIGEGEWGFSAVTEGRKISRLRNTVEGVTIDMLLQRFGRDRIAILKLDIEGSERDLLNGSADWIDRVDVVFAELHETFAPGCDAAWEAATRQRRNGKLKGEKVYSFLS